MTVSEEENETPNTGNICNWIQDWAEDVANVTCNYGDIDPPRRGRYIMIRKKEAPENGIYLNMCEVEVMSCRPGYWGYNQIQAEDCSLICSKCRLTETCRVSDGYSHTGCKNGFWGGSCDQPSDCGAGTPCDRNNGICPNSK